MLFADDDLLMYAACVIWIISFHVTRNVRLDAEYSKNLTFAIVSSRKNLTIHKKGKESKMDKTSRA